MKIQSLFYSQILIILFLFTSGADLKAQSGVVDAYAKVSEPNGQGNLTAQFIIELSDTNNVSQVEILLGSASGESDLVNHVFDYDVTSGLGSWSYVRNGNKIIVGTTGFVDSGTYFGSVRIKDNSSQWSNSFSFITN